MNGDTYYMSASEIASATQQYTSSLQSSLDGVNGVLGEVDSFINGSSAELQGAAWDTVRDHIGTYRDTIDSLRDLNNHINTEMNSALQMIQDFLEPDSDLNTADLPKFEQEKANLEQEIQQLEQENAQLEQVQCVSIPCDDGSGSCGEDCSARDAAQRQIAENNQKISEVLQPQLDEVNRLIDKINKFVNEILPQVNAKLEQLYNEVMEFNQKVNDLVMSLPEGSSIRDKYEQQTMSYDLNTSEGRFLKIYDLLTQKYGYSEWGAKAIIASMYGTNSKFLPDRFQGDNGPNAGYGLCQWEYLKYGGTTDHAQQMEDWCNANGYDYRTIDGQVAWLDYFLPIVSEGYHTDLAQLLKTGGEDQYWEMASKFGVYHQGTQGDPNKNYYRAYDGNLWNNYFSLIDNRESMKTANNVNIEKPPSFQMGIPDASTSTGQGVTSGSQGSGHWSGGSYQSNQGGTSGTSSSGSYSGGGDYSGGSGYGGGYDGGGSITPSKSRGNAVRLAARSDALGNAVKVLDISNTQTTEQLPAGQKIAYQDFVVDSPSVGSAASVGSSGGRRSYQYVGSNTEPELASLEAEEGMIEPVKEQVVQLKAASPEYTVASLKSEPVRTPKIDFVENKPLHDLGPQPGEKLVEMSVTELTKGTPEEAVRNPVATAAIAAIAVGAAGAATVAALKHDDDIDEDKTNDIGTKDYY